jgi:hypothetical protein
MSLKTFKLLEVIFGILVIAFFVLAIALPKHDDIFIILCLFFIGAMWMIMGIHSSLSDLE